MKERLGEHVCGKDGVLPQSRAILRFWSFGFHSYTFLSGLSGSGHKHWAVKALVNHHSMSDAAFKVMVLDMHKHVLAFAAALKQRDYPFAVITTPPPTRRFKQLAMGYSEADLIFVDGRLRNIMSDAFARLGVDVIRPPDTVYDNGFLQDRFYHENPDDHHHGNKAYGQIVLAQVAEYLARFQSD